MISQFVFRVNMFCWCAVTAQIEFVPVTVHCKYEVIVTLAVVLSR